MTNKLFFIELFTYLHKMYNGGIFMVFNLPYLSLYLRRFLFFFKLWFNGIFVSFMNTTKFERPNFMNEKY